MKLESIVIKENEYPNVMDWKLAEMWAEGIPLFKENDPENPEWKATPIKILDLSSEGYGQVYVKDESKNPTKTIKDRMAWELTTLFRDYARGLHLKKKEGLLNGNIGSLVIPRFTYVTSGNVGKAISEAFKRYSLPPMKLLVDNSMPAGRLDALKGLHADIYMADLSKKPLTAKEIKELTNNRGGIDITSVVVLEPNSNYYDWHVHEAFNEDPNEIYVPYGSGRLMENYLTWQARNARNKDPRLKIPAGKLTNISVLGAEPIKLHSIADKLTKKYNPFVILSDQDINALGTLSFTGKNTGVYHTPEEKIKQGYEFMKREFDTEPTGSAGLGLYLHRYDQSKIDPRKKVLIINTGKGIS
jgi:threonine synthase